MVRRTSLLSICLATAALALAASGMATDLTLNIVQYPDGRSVEVPFVTTDRAPSGATLEADVSLKGGQARVDLSFKKMQPAALFGGNIGCYVAWAVNRAGIVENLGEVFVDSPSGSGRYQTGMKEFAMFVTAEPVPGIWRPSDMVVFTSGPTRSTYAKNSTLPFSGLAPALKHDRESIGILTWTSKEPVVLYQARRAFEVGSEMGLAQYDEKSMKEAQLTLTQATNVQNANGSSSTVADYSRRTVALVTTAARAMYKAAQEKAAAEAAAKRQAELDALSQKAVQAQQSAAAADAARKQAEEAETRANLLRSRAEVERSEAERAKAEMAAAAAALAAQKSDLEAQMASLKAERDSAERAKADLAATAAALDLEKKDLEAENQRIAAERDALARRLIGALASVAETQNTARGVVVSFSDILFDTNKATLKTEAQIALAKLTGVLSVFPNLNLRIEGYTDSTGSDEINNRLSRDRAAEVVKFLQSQGIAGTRMTSDGYGSRFPVASNETKEGRAKNRRVEVILAEGVIAAPKP